VSYLSYPGVLGRLAYRTIVGLSPYFYFVPARRCSIAGVTGAEGHNSWLLRTIRTFLTTGTPAR
jgi:hypothetical protein